MVGAFMPARVVVRRLLPVLVVATILVPAFGPVASAATPARGMAASEVIEQLRERARITDPPVFATIAGQPLVLPGAVRAVGFHESGHGAALAMSPVGRLDSNHNAGRIALPQVNGYRDNSYLVMPTRSRGNGPTSAVDISMVAGEPVTSPITGTVKSVSPYNLYGSTPDLIVELVPEGRPELRVRMMHIDGVDLQPGDEVEAGKTVLAASSRQLPFSSQIDRYAGAHPHVHLEVLHQT